MKYKMIPMTAAEIKYDAHRYAMALSVLDELRRAYKRNEITAQEYRDLRNMALNGDKTGATRGLAEIRGARL